MREKSLEYSGILFKNRDDFKPWFTVQDNLSEWLNPNGFYAFHFLKQVLIYAYTIGVYLIKKVICTFPGWFYPPTTHCYLPVKLILYHSLLYVYQSRLYLHPIYIIPLPYSIYPGHNVVALLLGYCYVNVHFFAILSNFLLSIAIILIIILIIIYFHNLMIDTILW